MSYSKPLSPPEIKELVQAWMEGQELDEIQASLDRYGKLKSIAYLKDLFMGRKYQEITGLERSHTYLEAVAKYRICKKENLDIYKEVPRGERIEVQNVITVFEWEKELEKMKEHGKKLFEETDNES